MRNFTMIAPQLWQSDRFRGVPPMAQLLHLYLLTCRHQNSAACCSIPDGYILTDLRWTPEELSAAKRQLVDSDLIAFDPQTDDYFIRRFYKYCAPQNPKHIIAIKRFVAACRSDTVRNTAQTEFAVAEELYWLAHPGAGRNALSGGQRPYSLTDNSKPRRSP